MYSRNVHHTILQSKYNLKNIIVNYKSSFSIHANINIFKSIKYSIMFRQLKISSESYRNAMELQKVYCDLINSFRARIMVMPRNLKDESSNLLRVWSHQCECVLAQRVRRGQQMFSLYSRLWGDQALKEFIKKITAQVSRRSKDVMFSAIGVSLYNWDKNRISDAEIESHLCEIDYVILLRDNTTICEICHNNKLNISKDKSIIEFCDCKNRKNIATNFQGWLLFIDQPELIVWRRLHKSGAYEYKVYGTYNDVSAEDFLNVQIDTQYRKTWDASAIVLESVDSDPKDSASSIIYWEMQWPRLFANRDYVFNRRFMANNTMVVILNKGTTHPKCPKKSKKHRVEDYWSSMVIKAYKDVRKPGIEFSLTYFDNPGVNIPSAVTSWVAYRAMPDFLTNLRKAAKEYKNYCAVNNCQRVWTCTPQPIHFKLDHDAKDDKNESSLLEILSKKQIDSSHKAEGEKIIPTINLTHGTLTEADIILSPSTEHDQTYWKYLQPNYYLG